MTHKFLVAEFSFLISTNDVYSVVFTPLSEPDKEGYKNTAKVFKNGVRQTSYKLRACISKTTALRLVKEHLN